MKIQTKNKRNLRTPVVESRIDKTEELLCTGFTPGQVQRHLSTEFGITTRQIRDYISIVHKRWAEQAQKEAPHRREKNYRMVERFYARCIANDQYSAAAQSLGLLAKMSGSFHNHDAVRQAAWQKLLSEKPTDPTVALVWAQRALLMSIEDVVTNSTIDPVTRLRHIGDLASKVGMTHSKALMQAKLDRLDETSSGRMLGLSGEDDGMATSEVGAWAPNSRFGQPAGKPADQPGAEPSESEDEGDPPDGGGDLGPH